MRFIGESSNNTKIQGVVEACFRYCDNKYRANAKARSPYRRRLLPTNDPRISPMQQLRDEISSLSSKSGAKDRRKSDLYQRTVMLRQRGPECRFTVNLILTIVGTGLPLRSFETGIQSSGGFRTSPRRKFARPVRSANRWHNEPLNLGSPSGLPS